MIETYYKMHGHLLLTSMKVLMQEKIRLQVEMMNFTNDNSRPVTINKYITPLVNDEGGHDASTMTLLQLHP